MLDVSFSLDSLDQEVVDFLTKRVTVKVEFATDRHATIYHILETDRCIEIDHGAHRILYNGGTVSEPEDMFDHDKMVDGMVHEFIKQRVADHFPPGTKIRWNHARIPPDSMYRHYNYSESRYEDPVNPVGRARKKIDARIEEFLSKDKLLDVEVMKLASNLFGRRYTLEHYNFCWANLEGLKEIKEKLEFLWPMVLDYYKEGLPADGAFETDYWRREDILRNWKGEWPGYWTFKRPNFFKTFRAYVMKRHEMSKADWATLINIEKEDRRRWIIADDGGRAIGIGYVLQAQRENKNRFPRITAMRALAEVKGNRDGVDPRLWRRMMVEALKASYNSGDVRNWVNNEWIQVRDWVRRGLRNMRPDANQLKLDWKGFVRKSEQWHDEEALKKLPATTHTWDCAMEAHTHQDTHNGVKYHFGFIPLTSNRDMVIEGNSMVHCVGGNDYVRDCKQGMSLIFSIRTTEGNRLATCQLQRYLNGTDPKTGEQLYTEWKMTQIRGKRNAKVTPELEAAGYHLAKRYNQLLADIEEAKKKEERDRKKAEMEAKKKAAAEKRKAEREAAKDDRDANERLKTRKKAQPEVAGALPDPVAAAEEVLDQVQQGADVA